MRFRLQDVWEGYAGGEDCVDVELYQPWLERATPEVLPLLWRPLLGLMLGHLLT